MHAHRPRPLRQPPRLACVRYAPAALPAAVAAVGGLAQFAPDKLADIKPLADQLTGDDQLKLRGIVFAVGGVMVLLFGKLTFKSKKKKKK